MPLSMPYSQWSNQCSVCRSHSSTRQRNGVLWLAWCSHSLRGTPARASAFHHWADCLVLTFQSFRPCTTNTAVRTLLASLT